MTLLFQRNSQAGFEQNINQILPIFEEKGIKIRRVDGVGDIGEVTDRLVDVVEELDPEAREQNEDVNGGDIERSYGE